MTQPTEFCPAGGCAAEEPGSPATMAGEAAGALTGRLTLSLVAGATIWAGWLGFAALRGAADAVVLSVALGAIAASSIVGGVVHRARERDGQLVLFGRRLPQHTLHVLGGVYLLLSTFAVAWVERHLGMTGGVAGVSWNAVWVAFVPIIIPCAPLKTLIKALMAASTTPLAIGLHAFTQGVPMPGAVELFALVAPVYVSALLAFGGALYLSKIGGELEKARSIGRYELRALLGRGGMGEVWEARHRQLARPVAIKLVRPERAQDGISPARFEREAKATARLKSAHTVQLYDYGITERGELFYVMELLEGLDLEALVERFGPVAPARVAHVLRQATESLQEAHARGLVHRDIKPGNLHLGRYGIRHDHLKVLDFGLVKGLRELEDGAVAVTADEHITGTPAYLAPEVITGGPIDGRADLYALGCVAYFLLTGRRVFDETLGPLQVAVAHVTEDPEPPSRRGDVEVPRALEDLVLTLLEKDPVRRPDAWTLEEMLDELDLGERWTQGDARRWWADHAPECIRESEPPPTPAPSWAMAQGEPLALPS
jgi:tRNA A-37 threonylcarbamoyl transferase component Bud32